MKTISVIIPVYFNAESLPVLFDRLQKVEIGLLGMDMKLELIFVDDGSRDDSLEALFRIRQARPATRIVKLTRNFGVVHAIKCGMQFITGDCFMSMAADLQDPPELILQMAEKWQKGSKFTVCVRASREDPWLSKIFSAAFYWLLRRLVMPGYPKGGYDLTLMDRSLLPHLLQSSKNLYTPLLSYWLGYEPQIIAYHRPKRAHGKSRWTFSKKFTAFLDIMMGFSITPIRLISGIGVIVSFCSFLYGSLILYSALTKHMPVQGFASIVVLITFLLGLIIIMLGVIGEYLWRVFDELNKRPEVVIDEVY